MNTKQNIPIVHVDKETAEFVAVHVLADLTASNKQIQEAATKVRSTPRIVSIADAFQKLQK